MNGICQSENTGYIFLPFCFESRNKKGPAFSDFYQAVRQSGAWQKNSEGIRYLHKYVTRKLMLGSDRDAEPLGTGYQYVLDPRHEAAQCLHLGQLWYDLKPRRSHPESDDLRFTFTDARLFFFSTGIGILALRLRFAAETPAGIGGVCYHLRKITSRQIRIPDGDAEPCSLVELADRLFASGFEALNMDYCFYSTEGNERANLLTYVTVDNESHVEDDLFYLKWCYHSHFERNAETDAIDSENYAAASGVHWGISPSAAACLVYKKDINRSFLDSTFYKNFHSHYLWTYVLLLHQKYTMYLLLTNIDGCDSHDVAVLENYKRRLYEFETDFMFSYISEVPQYQRLYTKVSNAFALEQMFQDVQEPVTRLAEVLRQQEAQAEKSRQERTSRVLALLSGLTIVSTLADAGNLGGYLEFLIGVGAAHWVKLGLMAASALCAVTGMVIIFRKKKKDKD